jgi:hypothetical protein
MDRGGDQFGNACCAWQLSKSWQPTVAAAPSAPIVKPAAPRKKEAAAVNTPSAVLDTNAGPLSPQLLYVAAGVVGFAFFLMELVWYRMLAAILGGTTFTFGLILAVALAGIGLGGALYPLFYRTRQPTARDFALTCGWEALAVAAPFALGDRIAILALVLQDLRSFGFVGQIAGWTTIAAIVVFPAALVSGLQFPLLISLLGQGSRDVGQQVGRAFAWNTVGAMAGSLAAVRPAAAALGAWRVAAGGRAFGRAGPGRAARELPARAAGGGAALSVGDHQRGRAVPLGAGSNLGLAARRHWRGARPSARRCRRHNELRGANAVATSPGRLTAGRRVDRHRGGVAFLVNGKSDGNSIATRPANHVSVLGAILPIRRGLVIGLGTGDRPAGWRRCQMSGRSRWRSWSR